MELLKKFLENELGLNPDEYLDKFMHYEELLLEWNRKINLISRKSDSIEGHILNSIFFLTKYKLEGVSRIADIGTGGGFPGIPLKILFPQIEFLLIDSIQKKITVVKDIIESMNLKMIQAKCGRAEIISERNAYEGKFDIVISKAVAPLDQVYEWGRKFLVAEGDMLCIKGGIVDEELTSLKKLRNNFQTRVIDFYFDKEFMIEDKKLVVISKDKNN